MAISSTTLASIIIGATAITGSATAYALNYSPEQISGSEQTNTLKIQDPSLELLPDGSNQIIPPSILPNPTGTPDPLNPPIDPPAPYFNGDDDDDYEDDDDDSEYEYRDYDEDSEHEQGRHHDEYEDEEDDD